MLQPSLSVGKSHLWELFDGKKLRTPWQHYKWPGPGLSDRAVTQSLLSFLCQHCPSLPSTLRPFPMLRVRKPSFAHMVTLPLPVLAPLQFPQSSEMCILLCSLMCMVPVRHQLSKTEWSLLHLADVSQAPCTSAVAIHSTTPMVGMMPKLNAASSSAAFESICQAQLGN